MLSPRIRFVWKTPPVPGGRWHAGVLNLKRVPRRNRRNQPDLASPDHPKWQDYRRHRIHLSLRGLLAWCLAAAFATYFGGAALLQQRLQSTNPRLQLHYLDLALPHRWENVNRQRGAASIAEGRELIAARRFNEGFSLLRSGLARNPSDSAARLEIAQIYTELRLIPQAIKTLREGLDHGYPDRACLDLALGLLENAESHAASLEICRLALDQLARLPDSARPAGDEAWLARKTTQTLLALGRSAESIAFAQTHLDPLDPFRREMEIVHHLTSGRPAEAADLARRWSADDPANSVPLSLLIRINRESGDFSALDADLARLRDYAPAQPEPLIVALAENHHARRPAAALAALDTLLFRHGADPALYEKLAPVLANLTFIEGLDRIEKELHERGLPLRPVLWARLDLAKSSRDWPAVLTCAEHIATSVGPEFTAVQAAWLETARLLAQACLDGASGTQTSLVEIVAAHPGGLRLYTYLIDSLLAANRPATARQILTLAEGPYPASAPLVTLRTDIEKALAANSAAPAATATTPPAPTSLAALEESLSTFLQKNDRASALALITSTRRARPDWLPGAETRLDALELPLLARGDDPLRLQLLARTVLPLDSTTADSLLALARQIHAEGRQENARLLADEILRHDPAHPAASAQLKLWKPDPPATTLATATDR